MVKVMYTQNMYLSPWLDKIKKLLDYNGMSNLFEEPGSVNHIWFKEAFKLRINDVNRQKWQEVVHNSSACLTYRIVTVQKDLQYYLINLPVKYAYDLCKFKCGNHKLPIVTGRFQNLAIDERVCRLCQLNDVGDEFHYVLRCPFFQENRKKFVKRYYYCNPSALKMTQLFTHKNYKTMLNLAKFTKIIMDFFNNL